MGVVLLCNPIQTLNVCGQNLIFKGCCLRRIPPPRGKKTIELRPLVKFSVPPPFCYDKVWMLGVDRRTGSAAQGSGFRPPSAVSLCICSSFVPAGHFWGHKHVVSSSRGAVTPCQRETGRYPVATHCSHGPVKQSCQRGSGYCLTSGHSEDLCFIVLHTQSWCTCRAYRAWTSFCSSSAGNTPPPPRATYGHRRAFFPL